MRRYTLNKYLSRLMALLLSVMLLLTCFPDALAAESGSCGSKLNWSFADGTLTVTGSGEMKDFTESSKAPWYHLRKEILRVSLPEGLTSIGTLAFYECEELTALVLPNSVKRIGSYAFAGCTDLQLLNLGTGLETVGESAFSDCYALASLTLPGTLRSIGPKAFYRCETITTLTVPQSVTAIGTQAFGYCKSLVSADVQAQIRSIPEFLFYGCNSLSSVKLPDSVENISRFAFRGCDQLSTVYYNGESKTPEEIQKEIDQDVPGFDGTGNVTDGDLPEKPATGKHTENEDGTITQENTTVHNGKYMTVSVTVINTHPTDSLAGKISCNITVTVEAKDGWAEAKPVVLDALKSVNETVTRTGSEATPPQITVYVKNDAGIDRAFIDELKERNVIITVVTQDGSTWKIDGTKKPDTQTETGTGTGTGTNKSTRDETREVSYDLRYEVTPGSAELCEELGTDRCFVVKFLASAQINAEVMIRLDPALNLQNATLFQRDKELSKIQSSVVDNDGYAHFWLASVTDELEYYIAMNLPQAQQEAIIPEAVQAAYGNPEYIEPVKYEITGRTSSWGMNIKQVSLILFGGMLGAVIVIGFVMFMLNKRKLRMGYIPDLDDDEDEE